ncbi:hypothetical protein ACQKO5_18975 [Novosphingobium subterraneum]|uniref:hypothetical protein n=1 Tax=Novosphingobium subterraneum TaxID=48936 RepID=UPI003D07200F
MTDNTEAMELVEQIAQAMSRAGYAASGGLTQEEEDSLVDSYWQDHLPEAQAARATIVV